MAGTDNVPREYDSIEVLFNVKGRLVWWPTTVLSSREREVDGTVKGVAKVEYAPFQKMKKSHEQVYFLARRQVNTESGDTTWRTAAEAADAGAGNREDADWKPRARAQDATTKFEEASEENVSEPEEDEGWGLASSAADDGKQPPRQRRRLSAAVESARSKGGSFRASASAGKKAQSRTEITRPSGQNTDALEQLMRRVATLEEGQMQGPSGDVASTNEWFVDDMKVLWRTRVLRDLDQRIKKPVATRVETFGAMVRGETIGFTVDCTFRMFNLVVGDIAKTPRGALFLPSLDALLEPAAEISGGDVLFESARALLNWLGVTADEDVRGRTEKWQKQRDGSQSARLLGGLQWSHGAVDKPLRVFVGNSCVRDMKDSEATGRECKVIKFANARWDTSNNRLSSAPESDVARVGDFARAEDLESVFRLSWRWVRGYDGRAVSAHGKRMGDTRLGELTLRMPTVTVKGNELCRDIRVVLESNFRGGT